MKTATSAVLTAVALSVPAFVLAAFLGEANRAPYSRSSRFYYPPQSTNVEATATKELKSDIAGPKQAAKAMVRFGTGQTGKALSILA